MTISVATRHTRPCLELCMAEEKPPKNIDSHKMRRGGGGGCLGGVRPGAMLA